MAISKKDKLCSWHVLSVRPSGSLCGDRCALIRGGSRPWVGCLDEVDLLFSAEVRRGVPGCFQACSASCGPPVHPSSLFRSPLSLPVPSLSLWLGSCWSFSDRTAKPHANSLLTGLVASHLTSANKMVKSTPPRSLLPAASQDLQIESVMSPWHLRPPDQAPSRPRLITPWTACVAVFSTAPCAQILGCAIRVGRFPHPHRAYLFFLFHLSLSILS